MKREFIYSLMFFLVCLLISFYLGYFTANRKQGLKIITSPMVIYDNLEVKKLEIKGLYGIIDETDLESIFRYKNTYEKMEGKWEE